MRDPDNPLSITNYFDHPARMSVSIRNDGVVLPLEPVSIPPMPLITRPGYGNVTYLVDDADFSRPWRVVAGVTGVLDKGVTDVERSDMLALAAEADYPGIHVIRRKIDPFGWRWRRDRSTVYPPGIASIPATEPVTLDVSRDATHVLLWSPCPHAGSELPAMCDHVFNPPLWWW